MRTRRLGAFRCICDYSELQLHLKSRVGKHWSYNAPAKLPTGLLNSCGLCYEEEIFLMHGLAVLNSSWCSVAVRRKAACAFPFCTSTSRSCPLSCGLEHTQINGMWKREGGLMCLGWYWWEPGKLPPVRYSPGSLLLRIAIPLASPSEIPQPALAGHKAPEPFC